MIGRTVVVAEAFGYLSTSLFWVELSLPSCMGSSLVDELLTGGRGEVHCGALVEVKPQHGYWYW